MNDETLERVTFMHHALWMLQQDVPALKNDPEIEAAKKRLERLIPAGEDAYCVRVPKGATRFLAQILNVR